MPLWLVFLAKDGSWQVNPKGGEMSAAKGMTSHTWKVPGPLEYKTLQLQDGKPCGRDSVLQQLSAFERHVQSKSHVGMENVTDSAGLLETHDVLAQ